MNEVKAGVFLQILYAAPS